MTPVKAPRKTRKRDQNSTKDRILAAGHAEFARHGYNGARIERIARRSRCNIRMIYHHFGRKEKFYLAVLEDTYRQLRDSEHHEELRGMPPESGMRRLVEFTFDYLESNPRYISMLMNENMLRGKFLKKSKIVPGSTPSRVDAVDDLLRRGQADGTFPRKVDPVQLYITIFSLCYAYLSNRHTLSIMFQKDVADPAWIAERRRHVADVVMTYLKTTTASKGSSARAALVG